MSYICGGLRTEDLQTPDTPHDVILGAADLIARLYVQPGSSPSEVRQEVDHLLAGVDPSIRGEVYRLVLDRM